MGKAGAVEVEKPVNVQKLKKFDLKVGDVVRHTGRYVEWDGYETKRVITERLYRVSYISEYVFMVDDMFGGKTSFMKKEYQTGEVRKVE